MRVLKVFGLDRAARSAAELTKGGEGMGYTIRVLIIVTLSWIAEPAGFGQSSSMDGAISGTVTDPAGAAIASAVVSITNLGTGLHQTGKAGNSGLYRFSLLPLGTYEIDVQATGFAPGKLSGIEVNAGATVTVNIPMQVAASTTQVKVTAAGALTDPDRTDLGATLDSNTTRNLPLVSRNPYNFILFQPNVSAIANTEFGVPRKVNTNGFNDRINYEIDGGNDTESDRAGIRLIPNSPNAQTMRPERPRVTNRVINASVSLKALI